jgi:hypothetical protein
MAACDWQHSIYYHIADRSVLNKSMLAVQRQSAADLAYTCGNNHYKQVQADFMAFFEGKFEVTQLK